MSMHADNRARLAAAMREKYKQAGQYDIGLFSEKPSGGRGALSNLIVYGAV